MSQRPFLLDGSPVPPGVDVVAQVDTGKQLAFVDHKWREIRWEDRAPARGSLVEAEAPSSSEHKALPRLWASSPDLEEISLQAWDALRRANAPVRIFRAGGLASRLETNDEGYPIVKTLTVARLRQEMAIAAEWYRKDSKGNEVPCRPPVDVITNMLAQPDVRLPMLERIVEAPAFAPDGSIQTEPGYHEAARRFYHGNGLVVRPVPPAPSRSDVGRAVELLSELLIDFPFVSEADRLNAIAAMLGPIVRDLVPGSTPAHLFEAPTAGTGKGLLADVVAIPATGRPAGTLTEARGEEEWRKRLTTKLRNASPFTLVDNIRDRLDSAALSAAITSPRWEDRLLGGNELLSVPVRTTWMITGNNPALSSEMARRCVRVRLDAGTEHPEDRSGFRHPLPDWAMEQRAELVWALLVITQAWIATGSPAWTEKTLGRFDGWTRTMGGIFATAGLEGFLGNLEDFRSVSDDEGESWGSFVDAWWDEFADRGVKAGNLFPLARNLLYLHGETKSEQEMSLGRQLGQKRDRRFGDRFIRKVGTGGSRAWKLDPIRGRGAKLTGSQISDRSDEVTEPPSDLGERPVTSPSLPVTSQIPSDEVTDKTAGQSLPVTPVTSKPPRQKDHPGPGAGEDRRLDLEVGKAYELVYRHPNTEKLEEISGTVSSLHGGLLRLMEPGGRNRYLNPRRLEKLSESS